MSHLTQNDDGKLAVVAYVISKAITEALLKHFRRKPSKPPSPPSGRPSPPPPLDFEELLKKPPKG